jgi:hypothetical protein
VLLLLLLVLLLLLFGLVIAEARSALMQYYSLHALQLD